MEEKRSWWQQIKIHPFITMGAIVALFALIVCGLVVYFGWDWTGFNGGYSQITTTNTNHGTTIATVKQPGKTLWDWLQLLGVLAIPVVVGFGAVWFTTRQTRISEANRKQQHDTEMQIAEDQQQEELLRTYFDKLSDLLLDKELSTNPKIQSIVRARTLAALHRLNTERKEIILRFLHDSDLLQYVKDFLYAIDLSNTDLSRIDLSGAYLRDADLSEALLSFVDLSDTALIGANLRHANLYQADIRNADIRNADLSDADLSEADLSGANLSGADLIGANLFSAKVTEEQLAKAKSLKGALMPDGSIHD